MPLKKKTPVRRKRVVRPYRRRRRRNYGAMTRIMRPVNGGFPASLFTTLKYVEQSSLNPGAGGSCSVNVYNLNKLYDPDQSGGGNQPRGFDELSAVYNQYYVKSAVVTVQFINTDTTYTQNIGICFRDSTTTSTAPVDYEEQQCRYAVLAPLGGTGSSKKLFKPWSYKYQYKQNYINTDNVGTVSGTGPAQRAYAHIYAGNGFGTDTGAVQSIITIQFHCLFTELNSLTQS